RHFGSGPRWSATAPGQTGVRRSRVPRMIVNANGVDLWVEQEGAGDDILFISGLADDTAALMDALEIESAHVVGSSMGGAIAQELALAHPGRVPSLVLNGTWCRGDRFLHEVFRNWMWSAEKADSIRDFLVTVNLWCFSPRIWNDGTMDQWVAAAEASPYAQSVDAFCRSTEALIAHDSADRVGGIGAQTLIT